MSHVDLSEGGAGDTVWRIQFAHVQSSVLAKDNYSVSSNIQSASGSLNLACQTLIAGWESSFGPGIIFSSYCFVFAPSSARSPQLCASMAAPAKRPFDTKVIWHNSLRRCSPAATDCRCTGLLRHVR
ncbi:hypothetical protein F2P81_025670 [Scophthalmus maximus]|uniref:Uncharacterized protein n=1 Tax=Scophthalmus maximus TaxID=52904 RepID=A0A6A4RPJ5_SCOMX|nr:hypothetical protein F2P81_025670 [Scophthalmus maximus]